MVSNLSYKIEISDKPGKKYYALFTTGKKVYFGSIKQNGEPYQQFKDRTNIKHYSDFDHNDINRKTNYIKRHGANPVKYSPGWFSLKYSWT